jgi:hypothetical protein
MGARLLGGKTLFSEEEFFFAKNPDGGDLARGRLMKKLKLLIR